MFRFILSISLLLFAGTMFAQAPLIVKTQANGNEVRIRWVISDPGLWLQANENGYTISRLTVEANGQPLSIGAQGMSRVELLSTLKPEIESNWPADELSQATKKLLYDTVWDVANSPDFNFADAVAAEEAAENRSFFAHALADRDFQLARKLALGYVDSTAVAGEVYQYIVTVNNIVGAAAGARGGLSISVDDLIPVSDLAVQNGDTSVLVGWSVAETEVIYTAYDIYRSPAGTNTFEVANEVPFMYGTIDADTDTKYAWFGDSIATYGAYDYYVRGLTPFGFTGPPSATVSGSSRPEALNILMRLDKVVETETSIALHWGSVTAAHNDKMAAQRIYRAASVKEPFEVVSATGFSVSAREWTDGSPLPAAYYIIELEDEDGHLYRTQPQLGQLEDLTPPAMPQDFTGIDEGNGEVVLTWAENTEADFQGYRLFRCYARGGEFAVTGPDILTGTTFTDNLGGKIINDSIYYRLQAEDGRANASEKTPVLVVARVDITPPGKPTLARINATPSGIAVTWKYSADDDVVRHELHRRPRGTRDWTVVVSVAAEAEDDYLVENFDAAGSVNYVDETELPRGDYEYQFLAFDEMNLGAGSEIVGIRPHDSGERGEIEDFAVSFVCADSTITTYLDQTVSEQLTKIIEATQAGGPLTDMERKATLMALELSGLLTATQFPEWNALSDAEFGARVAEMYGANGPKTQRTNCSIELEWSYPLDASIQHFQLYRSRRASRLRPYQALPVNYFFTGSVPTGRQLLTFVDRDAQPGVRYIYKVMAVHWDGGYSKEGRGVTVVVE
jgi:hypothetical protein